MRAASVEGWDAATRIVPAQGLALCVSRKAPVLTHASSKANNTISEKRMTTHANATVDRHHSTKFSPELRTRTAVRNVLSSKSVAFKNVTIVEYNVVVLAEESVLPASPPQNMLYVPG